MNVWTKEAIVNIINGDIANIQKSGEDLLKYVDSKLPETLSNLQNLLDQIPNAISGPLIPKTPKVPRKRDLKRIQTIPEDGIVDETKNEADTFIEDGKSEEQAQLPRARRAASQKAQANIKVQQSLGLGTKMRRPSNDEEPVILTKTGRPSRVKRTKSVLETSDEDDTRRPKKYSRMKQKSTDEVEIEKIVPKIEPSDETFTKASNSVDSNARSSLRQRQSRNKRQREESVDVNDEHVLDSLTNHQGPAAKKANIVNETVDIPETDVSIEPSMYEDAIGKSIPMNSTMNPNTTVTIDRKMLNVTVVLESLQMPGRMNETVTLKKSGSNGNSGNSTIVNEEPGKSVTIPGSPRVARTMFQSKKSLQKKMNALKETLANKEFDALITEDESSPERQQNDETTTKRNNKTHIKEKKRFTRSSLLSEDDDTLVVENTPAKTTVKDAPGLKNGKTSYKPNALFSPYAKDSVKKRVEAFEQAGLNSPKSVEIDAPTRVTRTKTRAMAAAEANVQTVNVQTIAQKLARKSLARAKKISLSKLMKENEEGKENNVMNSAQKPSRILTMKESMVPKQHQRTTPISKSRLQMPMSVNRIHNTPAGNQLLNQNKAMTASRANIVSSVESFLAPVKTLTKSNSTDNLAEKRRKMNDEDARRKRDEALKAMSDEKRRKREEKELKNKLAREAKDKLDMEKRLKLEKEREEKARAALIMQEKQREEAEKKRLVQLQRAQEKEEKRKQEEQMRLQRLQEQEEAERQLAEQKRREQEAERRKIAEARAQQAAALEAARLKAHYIAKAKSAKNQEDPTSYKLDSDPDDEESDDESRPKHVIPYWAQPSVRATQLAIQQHIPMAAVLQFFGTRKCTPDLTDLFKGIKKERLQRTSSAVWKTPPRYSMMADE